MVSVTRRMSWRTLVSRSGVPTVPRKYLLATMLVAVWDQAAGTSMPSCLKTAWPEASLMEAERFSQRMPAASLRGSTPSTVFLRGICTPDGPAERMLERARRDAPAIPPAVSDDIGLSVVASDLVMGALFLSVDSNIVPPRQQPADRHVAWATWAIPPLRPPPQAVSAPNWTVERHTNASVHCELIRQECLHHRCSDGALRRRMNSRWKTFRRRTRTEAREHRGRQPAWTGGRGAFLSLFPQVLVDFGTWTTGSRGWPPNKCSPAPG
jgi:hypothetical protein